MREVRPCRVLHPRWFARAAGLVLPSLAVSVPRGRGRTSGVVISRGRAGSPQEAKQEREISLDGVVF